ncbi:MAG: hypothetical protein Q9218_000251 [Villophora microphyllina]
MSLITASHDSLPYIDHPPPSAGPHSISAATALIKSSLEPSYETIPHPSLPPLPTSNLSPLARAEQDRIARKEPLIAIDTSRYEPDDSDTAISAEKLKQAYTSSTYLRLRNQQLDLLESFGKNAWLISNSQLEDILKGVEREVVEAREAVESVNRARKAGQESARGEMEGLEKEWKSGVGRVVEVEVEIERVEARRREKLREGNGEGR